MPSSLSSAPAESAECRALVPSLQQGRCPAQPCHLKRPLRAICRPLQPASNPFPTSMQAVQQETAPTLRNFLPDDQDMPEEPPTMWNVMPGEQARRMMAQPAWKTQLQRTQPGLQPLTPVLAEDGDTTSHAANMWSAPDGYLSSTSTQRDAGAARDAQDSSSFLDDAGNEYNSVMHICIASAQDFRHCTFYMPACL